MDNFITLPDHISFDEIAIYWCNLSRGDFNSIIFEKNWAIPAAIVYRFVQYSLPLDNCIGQSLVSTFIPSYGRQISIRMEKEFQPLLDYIEERSNV